MKRFISLPTWLLTKSLTPLLSEDHPWKNRKFTLEDWSKGATEFTGFLDLLVWFWIVIIIIIVISEGVS